MSWAARALALWGLAFSAFGGPDYDAFSDRSGHILDDEQHAPAFRAMVRDTAQLEAIHADAVKGDPRAVRVFEELEKRARELGIENRAIVSAVNALVAAGISGAALRPPPSGLSTPKPPVVRNAPRPSPNFERPTNPPRYPPAKLPQGHSVRVMPPTEQYPNGYWVQTNQHGQPVNPATGKPPANVTRPQARAQTHVPLPPKAD